MFDYYLTMCMCISIKYFGLIISSSFIKRIGRKGWGKGTGIILSLNDKIMRRFSLF